MPQLIDFTGRWQLTRRIDDWLAGSAGRFEGEASFTPEGPALAYTETGTLTLPGAAPMAATRRYLWSATPGGIAVAFADGRPFHLFDPAAPAPEAQHWCDPDAYEVAYDFTRWPAWSATWAVRGPRKDYRMESRYRR